jgi:hypothetical protein
MFNCKTKPRRKNADKIEGMASWLILGGVLPLGVALVARHQQGFSYDSFLTTDRLPYFWVIAMGIASLLVKRASVAWQAIIILGAIGLLVAAELSRELNAISGIVWPLIVLFIIFKQYRYDVKTTRADNNHVSL